MQTIQNHTRPENGKAAMTAATGNTINKNGASLMKRVLVFAFGVLSYAIGMASLVYGIGFVGDILVPKSIDSAAVLPFTEALLINLSLLGVFAIQHSVMARPAFKKVWTRIVPPAAERSVYVLLSGLLLGLMYWQWQPLGGIVWEVQDTVGRIIIYTMYGAGWALLVASTFLINHFDLFGLRQVWLFLRGKEYKPVELKTPWLYRQIRHPLYAGFFVAFWSTPVMTVTHLIFALTVSIYILVAIQLEERDLISEHGQSYRNYRKLVPMLVPSLGRKQPIQETA